MCVTVLNFIKIGRTIAESDGDLTPFKIAAVRHVGFWNSIF